MEITYLPFTLARQYDNVGNPLALGLVYTYESGTDIPAPLYYEGGGGGQEFFPAMWPLRLDLWGDLPPNGGGGSDYYMVKEIGPYRINVTSAEGVQQDNWPVDGVCTESSYPPPPGLNQTWTGQITSSSPIDPQRGEHSVQLGFTGSVGQVVTISLSAIPTIDTYLYLLSDTGTILSQDDDSGGSMNSLISNYILPYTGSYVINATSYGTSTLPWSYTVVLTFA